MAERSNWPPSQNAARVSSRQEPDETLYPSRIARKQVGLRMPVTEINEVKHFCFVEGIDLQDLTSIGWQLAMEEFKRRKAETGYPANQLTSQPLIDQIPISDEKKMKDIDPTIRDQRSAGETGYPVSQLKARLIEVLKCRLGRQTIETWFEPLLLKTEGETVVVSAPSPLVSDWISANFGEVFKAAMAAIGVTGYRWDVPESAKPLVAVADGPQESQEDRANRWLNFYAVVTGNRIWPKDRIDVLKTLSCSDAAIEGGILRSKLKVAGGKVRSFNYCLKSIFQINASGVAPQMLREIQHEWQQNLPGFGGDVVPIGRGK